MRYSIYRLMPRFDGYDSSQGDAHVDAFLYFKEKYQFGDEDMWMRFFVRSLMGKEKNWYDGF